MFALILNIAAFYLGGICFERWGIICGLTVFLVMAVTGTVMASILEGWATPAPCRVATGRVRLPAERPATAVQLAHR